MPHNKNRLTKYSSNVSTGSLTGLETDHTTRLPSTMATSTHNLPDETSPPSQKTNKKKRPRKTRFSIFGALGQKGGSRRGGPKKVSRQRRESYPEEEDGYRGGIIQDIFKSTVVEEEEYEQDDCNAIYEELCCFRRAKTVEEKAADTELFGRLGPPKNGEEEVGEHVLTTAERAEVLNKGTLVLARLLALPFILAALIAVDVYKSYEVPDEEISDNGGNVKGFERSHLPQSPIFFLPCGIQFAFNVLVVLASASGWSWAYSHRDRRRLQLASYLVYILAVSITEFAVFWPGFCDSSVWGLIGWIYSTSKASIRRCRDMSFACIGIYFFFNLLSLIWDGDQYTKTKIAVSPPGWARAMLILAWMCVCHVVFWLPESSSRASQKLKHKFSGDTAKLISAGEGSKALLSRVLPKELIPRVRKLQDGQAIADEFDNVTIIFAKVIGLHEMFETLPTVQVVGVIDRLFRQIDNLISEKHNKIEKIKTVGDTYMAGAGLPTPTDTHAIDLTHFAFALAEEIMKFNDHYRLGTEGRAEKLDYKIGISSGPIVAGVIGRANPVYDLWGDAANTASRMYSFGKKHRIQTTQATIDLIKQDFDYESRGIIWVKGKGDMEVFFVLGKIKLFLLFYFFQKVLNVYDTGGG